MGLSFQQIWESERDAVNLHLVLAPWIPLMALILTSLIIFIGLSLIPSPSLSSLGLRDAKCGKIQCQSSEARPLESNAVPIDTVIVINGRQIRCRGTHVYRGPEEEGDMLDPGLVMTGTKCGHNHVSSFLQPHSASGLQRAVIEVGV